MNRSGQRHGMRVAAASPEVAALEKTRRSEKEKKEVLGASSMEEKKVGRGVPHCSEQDIA